MSPTPVPGGYDLSDQPKEVLHGLLVFGNLLSAFSMIEARVATPQFWPITLLAAQHTLPGHNIVLTPQRPGLALCRVEYDGVAVPEVVIAMFFPQPVVRQIMAAVVVSYLTGDQRVAQLPLPPQVTLAGTADEWLAAV